MKFLFALGLVIFSFSAAYSQTPNTPYLLTQTSRAVQGELNALNADLQRLAGEWGASSGGNLAQLSDREVRAGLKSVLKRNPIVADAALVTADGILTKIEPAKFRKAEGKSIAGQSQFQQLKTTRQAVLGPQMHMVEGFEAMDLEVPILAANGRVLGSISAIFEPTKLLERHQDSLLKDMPFRLTLLQTDGRILYSSFGDPVFKNLKDGFAQGSANTRQLAQRILAEPRGEGIFDMNSADTSDDHAAYWVSVGLNGRELRLVMISDAGRTVPVKQVDRAAALRGLQKLAAQGDVSTAFSSRDSGLLDDAFIRFLQTNVGIYSVQAVDAKGLIFAGQPIGGAPVGYTLSAKRSGDRDAFAALKSGKAAQYEATLLEGGQALFTVVPVPGGKGGALMSLIRYR